MTDLDRRLVGHLTSPQSIAEVFSLGLRMELFEEPLCAAVYDFSLSYWLRSGMETAPTASVLEHEFPGLHVETPEETPEWLVQKVQQRYATNHLQDMLRQAATASFDDPVGTLRTLYATAYDAAEAVTPRLSRVNMANSVEDRRRRYGQREDRPGGIGLPYGIPELDEHTGGNMPGELAVIGAYSKTGKSFWLCNVAVHLRRQGYTPMLFTLEMSIQEMEERIDALWSGVSYNRLVHARLTPEERQDLHAAQDRMGDILVEAPEEGERTVTQLINRARQAGADYVLIDQLSFVEPPPGRYRTTKDEYRAIMKAMKNELRRTGKEIPALLAVQLNRESLNEPVQLKHFADASDVERFCDLALALERNKEERTNHVMRLHILGGRRTEMKSWLLGWELQRESRIRVIQEINENQ